MSAVRNQTVIGVKQLCGFERVELAAGEAKEIAFTFKREDFALVTPDERYVTETGLFEIMAGLSSKDEDLLKSTFRL